MVERPSGNGNEEPPAGRWQLRLLGDFSLAGVDAETPPLGKLDRALLAYLVLSGEQRHARAKLAALLWPDRSEAQSSLRTSLNKLRNAFGEKGRSIILPSSDPLVCCFDLVDIDVLIFEGLASQDDMEALERAAAHYGGDLLRDIETRSDRFDRWLQGERERLRRLAVEALCRLARLRDEAGLSQAALETARRVLTLDCYCQEAHRRVIEIRLRCEGIAAARNDALACRELFRRANIELEPATRDLLASVIEGNALAPLIPQTRPTNNDSRPLRKLAAILAADVDGFSRHMQRDDVGTFNRLRKHRKELFEPTIAEHNGRIFKLTGDGLMVEFDSAVHAVACAVVLQRGMAERNADTAEDRRIWIRIGINLGDVIIEDDDRHGEAVNIAARLQQMAPSGGIWVSRAVYEHVGRKLPVIFDPVGEQSLKNMSEPIFVYSVRTNADGIAPPKPMPSRPAAWRRWAVVVGSASSVTAVIWLVLWLLGIVPPYPRPPPPPPPIVLVDRTPVAVLPFESRSDDPTLAQSADRLSEAITNNLSRSEELFVIASYLMEEYKGKDLGLIAKDLGVTFLLQGSVEKLGKGERVAVALIDATNGAVVWTNQYDRPDPGDLLLAEDNVTASIVGSLLGDQGVLIDAARSKLHQEPPANLTAAEYYLEAQSLSADPTPGDIEQDKEYLEKAIDKDPKFTPAYVLMAWMSQLDISLGYTQSVVQSRQEKHDYAAKAVELDDGNAEAHAALGTYYADSGDIEKAEREFKQAEALSPNNADMLLFHGAFLPKMGDPERGAELAKQAVGLKEPNIPVFYNLALRVPYFFTRQFKKALEAADGFGRSSANGHAWRGVILAEIPGRMSDAQDEARFVQEHWPDWSVEARLGDLGRFARPDEPSLFIDGSRKAGLPLCASKEQWKQWRDMYPVPDCFTAGRDWR